MALSFLDRKFYARFSSRLTLEQFLKKYFGTARNWENTSDQTKILVELVHIIRPMRKSEKANIAGLVQVLRDYEDVRNEFSIYLKKLLRDRKFVIILTDAGILQNTNFFSEVKKRIVAKFLPHQPQKDTLEYVLNQVFFSSQDPKWINEIPEEDLLDLLRLLNFQSIYESSVENSVLKQILRAIDILMRRVNGSAMETDLLKMVPEYETQESPFLAFEEELEELGKSVIDEHGYFSPDRILSHRLMELHQKCEQFIEDAFLNSSKYGISLSVNQSLLRIKQELARLKLLLQLFEVQTEKDYELNTIKIAGHLIMFNCSKNNVRKLVDESTQLISYEITQHTAKTGEHYITSSKKEYMQMFTAAMGGGLIVGILCIIKVLLSKVGASDFGYALLYSANYSLGFIAIYLCGFTLATKQPAMTAAAFINELKKGLDGNGNKKDKYHDFAELFARLFRSQFIALVGNVIVAFPIALFGIWLIDVIGHHNIAESKADKLITDISPIHSAAIFHAMIAGVFLFLSGIISGSIANRDRHLKVPYRIKEHPLLKLSLGKRRTNKIADFYEKKWAGIISNFWFGVFMGTTASIGIFLGLNLDIRHITFASGNLALGLYGNDFVITGWMLFWTILGIGIIGLFNFLVSFSLSLLLAFRSRKIPFSEIRFVFHSNWRHFRKNPMSFFFPVSKKSNS